MNIEYPISNIQQGVLVDTRVRIIRVSLDIQYSILDIQLAHD